VERGLAETRSRARALILAGNAMVNGEAVTHAGANIRRDDALSLKAPPRYASRGGEKLESALNAFDFDVRNMVCADFGASTGGFTDCLLQRGAARVFAIDVGYGQIVDKLRRDARVVVMDRVNVRNLESLAEVTDLVTIDVSFISLKLVLPAAQRVMKEDGHILALVKPQFEAGRGAVGRGGVVRDPTTHCQVLQSLFETARQLDLGVIGLHASPLRGPAGNVEFLALMAPSEISIPTDVAIERVLAGVP